MGSNKGKEINWFLEERYESSCSRRKLLITVMRVSMDSIFWRVNWNWEY